MKLIAICMLLMLTGCDTQENTLVSQTPISIEQNIEVSTKAAPALENTENPSIGVEVIDKKAADFKIYDDFFQSIASDAQDYRSEYSLIDFNGDGVQELVVLKTDGLNPGITKDKATVIVQVYCRENSEFILTAQKDFGGLSKGDDFVSMKSVEFGGLDYLCLEYENPNHINHQTLSLYSIDKDNGFVLSLELQTGAYWDMEKDENTSYWNVNGTEVTEDAYSRYTNDIKQLHNTWEVNYSYGTDFFDIETFLHKEIK